MSNITVHKSNGDLLEVTLNTLFGMLADQDSYVDVLDRLNTGERFPLELSDGSAQVQRPAFQKKQITLPLGEYTARVKFKVELHGNVHCRANSGAEAKDLVKAVIRGQSSLENITIQIEPREVEALINSLEHESVEFIEDVEVIDVNPRLLLAAPA